MINEIRSVGKVLAQTTTEASYQGLTTITELLIIDIRSATVEEAMNKAISLLRERGWKTFLSKDNSNRQSMGNPRWENVRLTLEGLDSYRSAWQAGTMADSDPQIADAINRAQQQTASPALLVLDLNPSVAPGSMD